MKIFSIIDAPVDFLENQTVFPILSNDGEAYYCLGTGFFINHSGIMMTAKHVLFDKNDKIIQPLLIISWLNREEALLREVSANGIYCHPTADIAICHLTPVYRDGKLIENPCLGFSKNKPLVDSELYTYAYPKSRFEDFEETDTKQWGEFEPNFYKGKLIEITERGGFYFKGTEVYLTSILIDPGSSGGPVMNNEGLICGINSTGYTLVPEESRDPISYVTPFELMYEIEVKIGDDIKKMSEIEELGGIYMA